MPRQRLEQILSASEAVGVVSCGAVLAEHGWLGEQELPVFDVDQLVSLQSTIADDDGALSAEELERAIDSFAGGRKALPRELAYLIYTSGSTGQPKGVCCHHEGAMNTNLDLKDRFDLQPRDRVLALSSLSFDLSVFDVFGMLAAGGSLVVPPPGCVSPPDPSHWLDLVEKHAVTVWNTVPAFVELLVKFAEYAKRRLPASLRVIFMSGDWIPLNLPKRIRAVADNGALRIVSMGGATEAAIWSNTYEIPERLLSGWSSIPYGVPMRNQTMYVLDENLEHCEPWVTGVIFIGGSGTALGYKDLERTKKQFFSHPVTGEWLFRTGDLGRMRPGGLLEILGREDSQVKINGFRIELGEIETTVAGCEAVADSCVI
eukprot:g6782.t1